jgi:hypothetical protein
MQMRRDELEYGKEVKMGKSIFQEEWESKIHRE